jgi:chemotaxis protein CheX
VTIALSVSGEIRANVLYGMSLVTAQKVAFELIGQPVKEMDERAWSAMDELSKILAKRCIDYADKSGFKCRIDSVSVLQGRGTDVASGGPALIVPLSTRLGRIVIDISIEEPALSEQSEAAARAA